MCITGSGDDGDQVPCKIWTVMSSRIRGRWVLAQEVVRLDLAPMALQTRVAKSAQLRPGQQRQKGVSTVVQGEATGGPTPTADPTAQI